jgi:hypothetical protein
MGEHAVGLSDLLAALMLGVAAYCTGRLVLSLRSRARTARDADAVHAVMGVSMAGMLAPSLAAGPPVMWVLIFSASTVWFGWRVVREADRSRGADPLGQHPPHLLMSAAMVYMVIVVAWSGSMGTPQRAGMLAMGDAGTSAARWSLLTIALAALLFGDGALTFVRSLRVVPPVQLGSLSVALMEQSAPVAGGVPRGSGESSLLVAPRQDVAQNSRLQSPRALAPRSGMACQLVMSLVMGYMLLMFV